MSKFFNYIFNHFKDDDEIKEIEDSANESDYLIIRHAESKHNAGQSMSLNSVLSVKGCYEAAVTAFNLRDSMPDISSYQGIVSPYRRALQTAYFIHKICDVQFIVCDDIREYNIDLNHKNLRSGGMKLYLENRGYQEFTWDGEYFLDGFYKNEDLTEFIERIKKFKSKFENKKCLLVSHGAPCRCFTDLILDNDISYLEKRYSRELRNEKSGYNLIGGKSLPNCGVNWIKNGEKIWDSKVFYQ